MNALIWPLCGNKDGMKNTSMRKNKMKTIMLLVVLLIVLQAGLFCIKQIIFLFVERTDYVDKIASMIGMGILTTLFLLILKARKIPLSVFPNRFNKFYVIGTIVAFALLIATPSNYIDGFPSIIILIYGSVVTPIFEELIFRGYIWNKLNTIFQKEWATYIVSTVLFAFWHLGYIDSLAFRVETGLAAAMLWKVITGLCFGIVLGILRLKTRNCYSTMLLHSIMNIFGR
ncbi:CPBP family intramembrane metalloprotease [Christensenellaceae bacterium OttesenSCG-928-K19]|nr:CPBP family intramembrane metalloprotease [Christensenellaceae bacterium OttesenSCG-928-K19]